MSTEHTFDAKQPCLYALSDKPNSTVTVHMSERPPRRAETPPGREGSEHASEIMHAVFEAHEDIVRSIDMIAAKTGGRGADDQTRLKLHEATRAWRNEVLAALGIRADKYRSWLAQTGLTSGHKDKTAEPPDDF